MALTVHVTIRGRVQGVGYRAWTVGQAKKHRVTGWVRNRTDGTVEAQFQGEKTNISEMLQACEEGPLAARVNAVESHEVNEAESYTEFTARSTV